MMHALCMAAAQLDWEEAGQINTRLATLYRVLMIETNPIPVKWALFEMGLIGPHIRLPMTRLRNGLAELDLVPAA